MTEQTSTIVCGWVVTHCWKGGCSSKAEARTMLKLTFAAHCADERTDFDGLASSILRLPEQRRA